MLIECEYRAKAIWDFEASIVPLDIFHMSASLGSSIPESWPVRPQQSCWPDRTSSKMS